MAKRKKRFDNPYPALTKLLEMMGSDNDLRLKPVAELTWPSNAASMEATATQWDDEQLWTLACGEDSGQRELVTAYGAEDIYEWLNCVFDSFDQRVGYRREDFYDGYISSKFQ